MIKPTSHLSVVGSSPQLLSRATQSVLERLRQAVLLRLEPVCSGTLSKADDALFDMGQNTRASTSQKSYLDVMREIRRERGPMELLFRSHLNGSFHDFQQPGGLGAPAAGSGQSMTLLAEEDLEEQLAAEQTISTIHRRFKHFIEPITGGLARIAITINPIFDQASSPVSPENLANAFRAAMGGCDAPTEVKLVLFKLYERELLQALETLYPEVTRVLVEAGYIAGHGARVAQTPATQNPGTGDQVAQREYAATDTVGYGYETSEQDESMLNSLHELLQVWRKVQRRESGSYVPAPVPARPALTHSEMLAVLTLFQADLPEGLKTALQLNNNSLAQQIKRELITGAAALGISEIDAHIGDAEEDAIDVVGMMFEVFLDERDIDDEVRDQIARLLVPYIKVALIDRRLFLQKAHPARRLLNAIAEACEGNHGEGPHERELLQRVGQAVDRLIAEFNEDIAIFELLEQDLRAYTEQYRHRAELTERRVAEAQRGKERLEEARQRAEAMLARRLESRTVSPLVEEDLRRYWAHHYAVVFLREGEEGEGCTNTLRTLDQMLALADAAYQTGGLNASGETESLQPGLLAMLASSGLTDVSAAECARIIAQHLLQPPPQPEIQATPSASEFASPTQIAHVEIDPVFAQMQPVMEQPVAEQAADEQAANPPVEFDPADIARLRQLTVGTWVEFIGEDGRAQPGKLSWVSPISARMLFVNRRGSRMHVASVDELAAMMKANRLRLRMADTAFEQAMHQVLGRLRETTAVDPDAVAVSVT